MAEVRASRDTWIDWTPPPTPSFFLGACLDRGKRCVPLFVRRCPTMPDAAPPEGGFALRRIPFDGKILTRFQASRRSGIHLHAFSNTFCIVGLRSLDLNDVSADDARLLGSFNAGHADSSARRRPRLPVFIVPASASSSPDLSTYSYNTFHLAFASASFPRQCSLRL